jgi:putative aldouronate transport system substrate-binding protein
MNARKISAILMASFLVGGMLSGCKKSEPTSGETGTTQETGTSTEESASAEEPVTFPLKEKITIKNWVQFSSTLIKSLDENEVYKELEKRTNIHMEFIHPTAGQEAEQYNLMIASNDLPDLIQGPPVGYPGGPDKGIEDGIFLRLNDLIDKYAPNYKKLRASNPEITRQTMTDEGNIYAFNCIQKGEEPSWSGIITRGDWLEELGLKAPETIAEWETVLKAFKEKKKVEVPLIFNGFGWMMNTSYAFVGAYNVTNDFFNQDGTVKYGYIEPSYKEFLTTLNRWYKEGLIDKDFATRDGKGDDALFTSGKAGAMFRNYGEFGGYNVAGKQVDPKFTILPVINAKVNKDDVSHFRQTNWYSKGSDAILTTANKHQKETVAWLDYGYTDEGFLLYNYGVEGVSWDWADGPVPDIDKPFYPDALRDGNKHPQYNDFMLKNPNGTAFWDLVAQYKVHQQAYLRDPMANGGMEGDVLQSMIEWSKPGNDYVMPPLTHNNEENQTISRVMTDINTYVTEEQLKFIMGTRPLDEFDAFVEQVKSMGIDEIIQIKQTALERYKNRK